MNVNTRIYDRKHKHDKDQAEEDHQRLVKAFTLAGKSALNTSPQTQINALDDYIQGLRYLIKELKAGYGPAELKDSIWRVEIEISRSVAQITRLKIEQIEPEV